MHKPKPQLTTSSNITTCCQMPSSIPRPRPPTATPPSCMSTPLEHSPRVASSRSPTPIKPSMIPAPPSTTLRTSPKLLRARPRLIKRPVQPQPQSQPPSQSKSKPHLRATPRSMSQPQPSSQPRPKSQSPAGQGQVPSPMQVKTPLHTPKPTRKAPQSRIVSSQSPTTSPRHVKTDRRPPTTQRSPRRMSTGPLSEHTMSQIRCPTRVDFLNAVNGLTSPSSSFSSPKQLPLSLNTSHAASPTRPRMHAPRVALRTSRLTDETADDTLLAVDDMRTLPFTTDDDEPAVPAYLNERVLDAMDRMSECDELRAIVHWADDVRKEHKLTMCMTDIDLTNGVALLEVLHVVAREAFAGPGERAEAAVEKHLDEHGRAAADNIGNVRAALQRFPWRDGPDGAMLNAVPFDRVDVWGLAGFVVLAAVTGATATKEVDRMLEMDEWVQDRLSDVVTSGLDALGAGKQAAPDRHSGWFAERKKREMLEHEMSKMQKEINLLVLERDQLEADLSDERAEAEQTRAELRWLRSAVGRRRRVLGETNDAATTNVDEYKMRKMQQL